GRWRVCRGTFQVYRVENACSVKPGGYGVSEADRDHIFRAIDRVGPGGRAILRRSGPAVRGGRFVLRRDPLFADGEIFSGNHRWSLRHAKYRNTSQVSRFEPVECDRGFESEEIRARSSERTRRRQSQNYYGWIGGLTGACASGFMHLIRY